MRKVNVVVVAGLLLLSALGARAGVDPELQAKLDAARARLDAAARELAQLHESLGDQFRFEMHSIGANKAFLGILLGPVSGDGVRLLGVTPGSGAEAAGLAAGDVVTAINDAPVLGSARNISSALADVAPGAAVDVEFERGGERRTASVVTAPHGPAGVIDLDLDALPVDVDIAFGHSLRLQDMDADLARYFGLDTGVLVLRAPTTTSAFKSGDVILSVAGEAPANAAEARRLLASAQGQVECVVRRQGTEQVLSVDGSQSGLGPLGGPHFKRVIKLQHDDGTEETHIDDDG